jgi:hypothetical protein
MELSSSISKCQTRNGLLYSINTTLGLINLYGCSGNTYRSIYRKRSSLATCVIVGPTVSTGNPFAAEFSGATRQSILLSSFCSPRLYGTYGLSIADTYYRTARYISRHDRLQYGTTWWGRISEPFESLCTFLVTFASERRSRLFLRLFATTNSGFHFNRSLCPPARWFSKNNQSIYLSLRVNQSDLARDIPVAYGMSQNTCPRTHDSIGGWAFRDFRRLILIYQVAK